MAKAKSKRIITIETLELTVFRQDSPQFPLIWCEFWAAEVEMIAPKSAACLLGISVHEVFRQLERGDLHFFEMETGEVFICQNSLFLE